MVAPDIHLATEEELLRRYAQTKDPRLRSEILERYIGFARAMAHRYEGRGEPTADLVQVASLGLINAIDRFDPERGRPFLAFATPTVLGELRRHFRDKVWTLRLPRSLQERTIQVDEAATKLGEELGRAPTADEIASALGVEREDVLDALQAASSRRVRSLDAPSGVFLEGEQETLGERLGQVDAGFEHVEDWGTVLQLLPELSDFERTALSLRLVDDLTQSEIGKRLGCSQMQVSRILRRSLERLRTAYEEELERAPSG
jgi:RNA polymerase sigma-B factor